MGRFLKSVRLFTRETTILMRPKFQKQSALKLAGRIIQPQAGRKQMVMRFIPVAPGLTKNSK